MIVIVVTNIFILLFFAVYIEVFSKVGNILFRVDSTGLKKIQLFQLIAFMFAPLEKNFLWYPRFWDINWFIFTMFLNLVFYLYLQLRNHLSTTPKYSESENLDL